MDRPITLPLAHAPGVKIISNETVSRDGGAKSTQTRIVSYELGAVLAFSIVALTNSTKL